MGTFLLSSAQACAEDTAPDVLPLCADSHSSFHCLPMLHPFLISECGLTGIGACTQVQAAAAQLQQQQPGRVSQRAQSGVEAAALCALLQQGHMSDALLLLRQQSAALLV